MNESTTTTSWASDEPLSIPTFDELDELAKRLFPAIRYVLEVQDMCEFKELLRSRGVAIEDGPPAIMLYGVPVVENRSLRKGTMRMRPELEND